MRWTDRDLNDLVSVWAHDLRNALQAVEGWIQLGQTQQAMRILEELKSQYLEMMEISRHLPVPEAASILMAQVAAKRHGVMVKVRLGSLERARGAFSLVGSAYMGQDAFYEWLLQMVEEAAGASPEVILSLSEKGEWVAEVKGYPRRYRFLYGSHGDGKGMRVAEDSLPGEEEGEEGCSSMW
ncbi:MAG: hypothetical protein QJR00_00230 [Bacillota bacterium]|nr:hypothetical protein [Bacillota bacterium]